MLKKSIWMAILIALLVVSDTVLVYGEITDSEVGITIIGDSSNNSEEPPQDDSNSEEVIESSQVHPKPESGGSKLPQTGESRNGFLSLLGLLIVFFLSYKTNKQLASKRDC